MNIDKKVAFIKYMFLISAIGLVLSVLLSFFINHVIINGLLIISFLGTGSVIILVVVLFILYWVGWSYNRIATYYFRTKQKNDKKGK